jgi:hypothetical protein
MQQLKNSTKFFAFFAAVPGKTELEHKRSHFFEKWQKRPASKAHPAIALETHPETGLLVVCHTINLLFSTHGFLKEPFPDEILGLRRIALNPKAAPGACPSIRRGRAQGACTASARREEEAMR